MKITRGNRGSESAILGIVIITTFLIVFMQLLNIYVIFLSKENVISKMQEAQKYALNASINVDSLHSSILKIDTATCESIYREKIKKTLKNKGYIEDIDFSSMEVDIADGSEDKYSAYIYSKIMIKPKTYFRDVDKKEFGYFPVKVKTSIYMYDTRP